ncbi:MAG: hypothetical protein WC413_03445 [Candidatus Nanoarchaeia archaeon]
MNKKGIFLPLLAIFAFLFTVIFLGIFYSDIIKDEQKNVGMFSTELINFYTEKENMVFSIQENAKLAACNALQISLEKGLLNNPNCLVGNHMVWDFTPNCNPIFSEYFESEFKNNFKERVKTDYKYTFTLDYGNKIKIKAVADSLTLQEMKEKMDITYKLNINFNTEINADTTKIQEIIDEAYKLKTCLSSKSFEVCSQSSNLQCIQSDSLIKCNVQNIKNPCTNENIAFVFALKSSNQIS